MLVTRYGHRDGHQGSGPGDQRTGDRKLLIILIHSTLYTDQQDEAQCVALEEGNIGGRSSTRLQPSPRDSLVRPALPSGQRWTDPPFGHDAQRPQVVVVAIGGGVRVLAVPVRSRTVAAVRAAARHVELPRMGAGPRNSTTWPPKPPAPPAPARRPSRSLRWMLLRDLRRHGQLTQPEQARATGCTMPGQDQELTALQRIWVSPA
jgi:hypothetical protein